MAKPFTSDQVAERVRRDAISARYRTTLRHRILDHYSTNVGDWPRVLRTVATCLPMGEDSPGEGSPEFNALRVFTPEDRVALMTLVGNETYAAGLLGPDLIDAYTNSRYEFIAFLLVRYAIPAPLSSAEEQVFDRILSTLDAEGLHVLAAPLLRACDLHQIDADWWLHVAEELSPAVPS